MNKKIYSIFLLAIKLSLQMEPKKTEETRPKPPVAVQSQEQILQPKQLSQQQEQSLQKQQQPPLGIQETKNHKEEQYQQNILNQRGLFQSLKE